MTMMMSRLETLGCIWGARLTRERRRLGRVSTWPFLDDGFLPTGHGVPETTLMIYG